MIQTCKWPDVLWMVWRNKLTQDHRGLDPESPTSPTHIFPAERRRIWPGAEGHIEASQSTSQTNTAFILFYYLEVKKTVKMQSSKELLPGSAGESCKCVGLQL